MAELVPPSVSPGDIPKVRSRIRAGWPLRKSLLDLNPNPGFHFAGLIEDFFEPGMILDCPPGDTFGIESKFSEFLPCQELLSTSCSHTSVDGFPFGKELLPRKSRFHRFLPPGTFPLIF